MKKFLILFLLALLGMSQTMSQEYQYVPFVREGVKWVCSSEIPYSNPVQNEHFFTLEFNGDAIINGQTYKAMHYYSGEKIDPQNDTIPVYMREEGKVVYAIVPDGKTYEECPIDCFGDIEIEEDIRAGREFILYDFNDPEGFIMGMIPKVSYIVHQVKPQTIMLGGRNVKRYVFRSYNMDFCFIEGIGCDGLYQGYPLAFRKDNGLLRMKLSHVIEDGNIIYRSERFSLRDDELPRLVREGVQWVNERVVINRGDTIRSFYTYEFKGKDDRERSLCHYYVGESLDSTQDSVIAKLFDGWSGISSYNNKALLAVASNWPERLMMNWFNELYSFDGYYESVLSASNPVMFYNIYQKGEDLTLDNFVEVEPIMIEDLRCKRYAYYGEGDEPLCYIVEGIGFDSRDMGDLLTPFTRRPDPDAEYQEYWGLSHVVKDGKVIYKGMRYNPALVEKRGDVNGDGNVTIADVSALIDMLIDVKIGAGGSSYSCDVNGDSNVSIADVSALIDMLLVQP